MDTNAKATKVLTLLPPAFLTGKQPASSPGLLLLLLLPLGPLSGGVNGSGREE